MAAQRSDLVEQISLLVTVNHAELAPLLVHTPALNPTFTGSSLTGGADADLIVDGCLIDLKSTMKTNLDSTEFMQIVTYALLDVDDLHKIRRVSLWYLRRPQRLTWDLDDLLTKAGSKTTRSELSKSLVDAGEQLRSERSPDVEDQG